MAIFVKSKTAKSVATVRPVAIVSAVFAGSVMLGACGGGGSDSGGGSGNFAGTYTGEDRLVQTGAGANNTPLPARRITVTINASNDITLNDGNNIFRGRLNGFNYTLRSQLPPTFLPNFNDTCSATLTHSGSVSNGAINGRYLQDGNCRRLGRVVVSGSYFLSAGRNVTREPADTGTGAEDMAGRAY